MSLPLNRPTAILFDWDGTLVDSMARVHEVLHGIGQELGFNVTHQQSHEAAIYGRAAAKIVFGLEGEKADLFWNMFCDRYFVFEANCALTSGAAELVNSIPADIPLAIVTNGRRDLISAQINHFGWANRFAAVVCVDEAPHNKPHPAPAIMALEMMGVPPSRDVWFIGDTRGDVECAHGAGLTSILLAETKPAFDPHHFFAHCGEIHAHFQKMVA